MKLVTPEQMRRIDAATIHDYGIPGLLLMENAASAVVQEAASMLGGCRGRRIVLLAGRGNNGGDAFAAARLLFCRGSEIRVFSVGPLSGISGDALANLSMLERIGIQVTECTGAAKKDQEGFDLLQTALNQAELVVDGIFGTGLSRRVEGIAGEIIEMVNAVGKPVLSIDIPSGIDGLDGSIKGGCIRADATVTFCLPKTGLALYPGCVHTGRLIVADIGIPAVAVESQEITAELIDEELVRPLIPVRNADSNKGDYGRVLIVTGSTGMTGSGCLASMAALRSGAGLVYAGVPKSLAPIYGAAMTEPIVLPLEDGGKGSLTEESAGQILEHMQKMNVAAIGPGLTATEEITAIVEMVTASAAIPLVLDADALNAIAGKKDFWRTLPTKAVITPHPGEMARLLSIATAEVQKDRVGTARRFAQENGVVTVLKGNRTVVAWPDGHIFINPTGNAGMASAGTGDVLAGLIAGLIAQGADTGQAAVAGVYLHGAAGDLAAQARGMHGMLAGDVIAFLPQVFQSIKYIE